MHTPPRDITSCRAALSPRPASRTTPARHPPASRGHASGPCTALLHRQVTLNCTVRYKRHLEICDVTLRRRVTRASASPESGSRRAVWSGHDGEAAAEAVADTIPGAVCGGQAHCMTLA